jgi:hypothetical protein
MNEGKTVAGAYQKIESHEELCAERYETIHEKLGDLKTNAGAQNKMLLGVLLALLGWMALQLWDGQVTHRPAPAAAISAP